MTKEATVKMAKEAIDRLFRERPGDAERYQPGEMASAIANTILNMLGERAKPGRK